MATWTQISAVSNATLLSVFGEPITYVSQDGNSIETKCILRRPSIEQSSSPGYFADIEIDPADVPARQRGDEVVWADGTTYVVGKIVSDPYNLSILALHRKSDS